MKKFLANDFLLDNQTAIDIFNETDKLPIIDYHCHLDAKEIYQNTPYQTLTDAWLLHDHYKFRAMRMMGIREDLVTGNAPKYDKFVAWATVLDSLVGHPLYHFSHMELKKYFGIETPLNKDTAAEIYQKANDRLANLTPQNIITKSNVETVITTNDPTENLDYHIKLSQQSEFKTRVLPAFRPDKAINIDKVGFKEYMSQLSDAANIKIACIDDLKAVLIKRLDYFNSLGCVASDHGLDFAVYLDDYKQVAPKAFIDALNGKKLSKSQCDGYKTAILVFLAAEYKKRNMIMEIHYGVHRNTNFKMFEALGADKGFDTIRANTDTDNLVYLLNHINDMDMLPKTVIFSLNPNDLVAYATFSGSFQREGIKGYVQPGAAWWFNDTKIGMLRHLEEYSALQPLDSFIGMLTDSRSLLSYARHEYFRRILANYLGNLVEKGEYPIARKQTLIQIAQNICYNNVREYFSS